MKAEFFIYQADELAVKLDVRLEEETIWLTQSQIVILFESSKANISEHIKHILQTGELEESTVRKIRTVQMEGKRPVSRVLTHYNLDMIISIGYRVNSMRGTKFRIWANKVIKDYLLRGYAVSQRMDRIEQDVQFLKEKVNDFDLHINTSLPPKQGVFFNGEVFDAYVFITNLIKSAEKSLILIDNYIDETVLAMLSKSKRGVRLKIVTSTLSWHQKIDIQKYSQQYPGIEIMTFTRAHDRFIIIDEKIVYHIGASLKDLGKKWFAFSILKIDPLDLINKLEQ